MYITRIDKHYTPFGSGLPRTPGLHLTQIIQSLRTDLGMSKTAEGWDMGVAADCGFLWEDAFSRAYAEKAQEIMRPGELTVEGVLMSPDGVGLDPCGKAPLVNHEYKLTWRSSNKAPADDFYWDTQFKCYCKGLGVTITCLHVIYIMGNYKGSGPHPEHFRIEYEQEEIDTAWGMVMRHAKEKGWV